MQVELSMSVILERVKDSFRASLCTTSSCSNNVVGRHHNRNAFNADNVMMRTKPRRISIALFYHVMVCSFS